MSCRNRGDLNPPQDFGVGGVFHSLEHSRVSIFYFLFSYKSFSCRILHGDGSDPSVFRPFYITFLPRVCSVCFIDESAEYISSSISNPACIVEPPDTSFGSARRLSRNFEVEPRDLVLERISCEVRDLRILVRIPGKSWKRQEVSVFKS